MVFNRCSMRQLGLFFFTMARHSVLRICNEDARCHSNAGFCRIALRIVGPDQGNPRLRPVQSVSVTWRPALQAGGEVLDFVVSRVPVFCSEATGRDSGETFNDCVQLANSRSSSCRRTMVGQFPDNVMSEAVFRDLSITMINCLVPQSGVVQP